MSGKNTNEQIRPPLHVTEKTSPFDVKPQKTARKVQTVFTLAQMNKTKLISL